MAAVDLRMVGLAVSGKTPMNGFSQDRLSRTDSHWAVGIVEIGTGALNRVPTCPNYKEQLDTWYLRVLYGRTRTFENPAKQKRTSGAVFFVALMDQTLGGRNTSTALLRNCIPNESSQVDPTVATLKIKDDENKIWFQEFTGPDFTGNLCSLKDLASAVGLSGATD